MSKRGLGGSAAVFSVSGKRVPLPSTRLPDDVEVSRLKAVLLRVLTAPTLREARRIAGEGLAP